MSPPDIRSVFEQFRATGTWRESRTLESGHINTTWVIRTVEEDRPDYILQKINHHVFPPVAEMMENIRKVTRHIQDKQAVKQNSPAGSMADDVGVGKRNSGRGGSDRGSGDRPIQVLEVIPTIDDKTHFTDSEGNHWRLYRKVDPGISYDVVPNKKVAYEAGKAFGQFIDDLKDLPAEELVPVIPDFHSVDWRYQQLQEAVAADPVGRVAEVEEEIAFAQEYIERLRIIPRQERAGKLPVRVTHNDTKLNNILFDEQDRAVCVIDLDTVMPGLSLYDFGDLIRTAANMGEEDEADLSRVQFSIPVFREIARGFLESTRHFLTKEEIELLPLSARYMTWLMGARFLADYINGDVYYQIRYPDQNRRRCRAQFRLIACMEEHYEESREAIEAAL